LNRNENERRDSSLRPLKRKHRTKEEIHLFARSSELQASVEQKKRFISSTAPKQKPPKSRRFLIINFISRVQLLSILL